VAWGADGEMSKFSGSDNKDDYFVGCGVLDFAGSGVVHMTGGVAALVGATVIGPRKSFKEGNVQVMLAWWAEVGALMDSWIFLALCSNVVHLAQYTLIPRWLSVIFLLSFLTGAHLRPGVPNAGHFDPVVRVVRLQRHVDSRDCGLRPGRRQDDGYYHGTSVCSCKEWENVVERGNPSLVLQGFGG